MHSFTVNQLRAHDPGSAHVPFPLHYWPLANTDLTDHVDDHDLAIVDTDPTSISWGDGKDAVANSAYECGEAHLLTDAADTHQVAAFFIAGWFKCVSGPAQTGGNHLVLELGPLTIRQYDNDYDPVDAVVEYDNGTTSVNTNLAWTADSVWRHIMAGHDGTKFNVWFDGVLDSSQTVANLATLHRLQLGGDIDSSYGRVYVDHLVYFGRQPLQEDADYLSSTHDYPWF